LVFLNYIAYSVLSVDNTKFNLYLRGSLNRQYLPIRNLFALHAKTAEKLRVKPLMLDTFEGVIAKLRKATISFVTSVPP
jgi:hypothetical protein